MLAAPVGRFHQGELNKWITRSPRQLNYYLSQIFAEHGSFLAYKLNYEDPTECPT